MDQTSTKEITIENYFCKRVEALGGEHWKNQPKGQRGRLDRIAVLPGGYWIICEFKRTVGGRVSWHQIRQVSRLAALGARVYVPKSKEDVDAVFFDYARGRQA